MIVMNVELNNFLSFRNFRMSFSYPKRIANSYIEGEYLRDMPNFRYKKIVVLMGANASGKTSLGQMLNRIFSFMMKKNIDRLLSSVCDRSQEASFVLDFIPNRHVAELYRLETLIKPLANYEEPEIVSRLRKVKLAKNDNYERAITRLNKMGGEFAESLSIIKGIPRFEYFFSYPIDVIPSRVPEDDSVIYRAVLENVLRVLDPSIERVHMLNGQNILIQGGQTVDTYLLSSGTKAGIAIANILSALKEGRYGFYYCDERFSYIQSDIEKIILTLMINFLGDNEQLLFTTHNTDVLDISLPNHSYMFLKKRIAGDKAEIISVDAAKYLKHSRCSVRNAVENDLFSVLPNTDLIYQIQNISGEKSI